MSDYTRFLESIEGRGMEWREELAMDSFERLEGGQRETAVKVMIRRLKESPEDWRVPVALGEAGIKSAIPALEECLETSEGKMRVLVMSALKRLGAPVDVMGVLRKALRERTERGPIAAIIHLEMMEPDEVPAGAMEELERVALRHPEAMVRCSAAGALMILGGVSTNPAFEHRPLYLSFHENAEIRAASVAQIKDMIAGVRGRK